MNDLFMLLFLLSFVALIVGLIKPEIVIRWGEKKTRGRVFLTYGIAIIAFFILFGVTAKPVEPQKETASKKIETTKTTKNAKTPEQIAKEKADAEAKAKAKAEAKAAEKAKAIADLKAQAQTIPYKDLARNPENYKSAKVKYTGKVIQVQEDGNAVGLRVNVTKDEYGLYDDTIYVMYNKSIVQGRVLENDIITFYGTSDGLLTYKTVLGAEMTIPQVIAQVVEIN